MARLIRMTGGNLRLLTRLLTQIERVLDNKKTYRGRNAQILVVTLHSNPGIASVCYQSVSGI
jgi:hypothetical protein